MNNIKQALKSAIEALELINNHAFRCGIANDAIKTCKEVLAEVEAISTRENSNVLLDKCEPQKQWVGLSDSDVMEITWDLEDTDDLDIFTSDFARAIEAKLKELNA